MVDGGEPGVDSRDEGKHTERNDLLFVEKMMWMGCSQFYAAGALRSSDAAYRYRYCDRLFGITDTTAFPV